MSEFTIGGVAVKPGERKQISLEVARLYDFTEMKMPVEVIRGKKNGPVLFLSGAIHGDEINGVEIIRRLLRHPLLKRIRGTVIAVPIVNIFGFNSGNRYLPDRRDLNRCFPGSEHGSMGSQLAHIFMTEIVHKATHGIDLHTGAYHRFNLPQIRANLDDPETRRLSEAFGVPVIISSSLRDGSLREAVTEHNIPMLLYEAGEALRFDEKSIRLGLRGILNVMQAIGMLTEVPEEEKKVANPYVARSSQWLRAPHSGIFLGRKKLGASVKKGEIVAVISNPFGDTQTEMKSPSSGIVIGMTLLPLANEGDALYHVATLSEAAHPGALDDAGLEMFDPINQKVIA